MTWFRLLPAAALTLVALVAYVLWRHAGYPAVPDLELVSAWLAPHRRAWYALPIVAATFAGLGLILVPVIGLVAMTGIVFGPWLGPIYAMAGSLASASLGFAIGRWAGRARVERLTGQRLRRVNYLLERNGTLAVFLLRKIPAPFMMSNIIVGASRVRYRDFMLGTLLGMCALVIALAGFGSQIVASVRDPSPRRLALAAVFLAVPATIAWFVNRALKRRASASERSAPAA